MLIVGIAKAASVFPQILFSNYFDSLTEKFWFNFWFGLTFLGDTLGILISKMIVDWLGLGWQANLIFFSALLIVSAVVVFLLIEDPPAHT